MPEQSDGRIDSYVLDKQSYGRPYMGEEPTFGCPSPECDHTPRLGKFTSNEECIRCGRTLYLEARAIDD